MSYQRRSAPPATPIRHRRFTAIAVALVGIACVRPGWSQEILTEADIVRLAWARAPGSNLADAAVDVANAKVNAAGLMPNPFVGWERETITEGRDSEQDVFRVGVPIDIARPLAQRSLAAAEGSWMKAEASLTRTNAVLDAVFAYYDVVIGELRITVREEQARQLDEAARVLRKREKAGTVSGYESTRLAIASEIARSQLAETRGSLLAAKARLAGLLGITVDSLAVDTTLSVAALPSETALAQGGATDRDVAAHARDAQDAAAAAQARAAWTWLPAIQLEAGLNLESEFETRHGYVAGLSLSVPVFDRGQGVRAEAAAQVALARTRAAAWTRSVQSDLASAYADYTTTRAELQRFDAATAEAAETLLLAAQSGYREGERSIVELLDAQRSRTEVRDRRLELLAAAKRAEARVRAAAGDLR